mgnify:CR=1 FL=1
MAEMQLWQALLLAVVQGLTEFLPISSSGHLVVLETWMGLQTAELLFFDVLLHVATLAAICIYFHKKIIALALSLLPGAAPAEVQTNRRMIAAIVISTLITGGIGLQMRDWMDVIRHSLPGVGVAFIGTGLLLWATSRCTPTREDAFSQGWQFIILFAVAMGLAQSLAILPGVSRSGATVCVAILLGMKSNFALEYSFVMSIPAIVGAALLELRDAQMVISVTAGIAGFVTALVSGLLFLWLLALIVRRGQLHYFAFYVIPLGLLLIGQSIIG